MAERINGEIIAGMSLATLAILFIYAGTVNPVWAVVLPADYILLATGLALIVLGILTVKKNNARLRAGHSDHGPSRY